MADAAQVAGVFLSRPFLVLLMAPVNISKATREKVQAAMEPMGCRAKLCRQAVKVCLHHRWTLSVRHS